jgi:hypothetical protein
MPTTVAGIAVAEKVEVTAVEEMVAVVDPIDRFPDRFHRRKPVVAC